MAEYQVAEKERERERERERVWLGCGKALCIHTQAGVAFPDIGS
jgi:hypothetical protein